MKLVSKLEELELHSEVDNHVKIDFDPNTYISPKFLMENKPSSVVYCRGINIEKVTMEDLFNLFSNYGNILKIVYIKYKQAILVEYQNYEHSTNAKDYLNNLNLYGKHLRVFFSNYN